MASHLVAVGGGFGLGTYSDAHGGGGAHGQRRQGRAVGSVGDCPRLLPRKSLQSVRVARD